MHDRPSDFGVVKRLPTLNVLHYCEVRNMSMQEFDRLLKLEELMYPRLVELSKGKSEG